MSREPRTCCICGAEKPWYHAGAKGYCKDHRAEAIAATRSEKRRIMSELGVREQFARHQPKQEAVPVRPCTGYQLADGEK